MPSSFQEAHARIFTPSSKFERDWDWSFILDLASLLNCCAHTIRRVSESLTTFIHTEFETHIFPLKGYPEVNSPPAWKYLPPLNPPAFLFTCAYSHSMTCSPLQPGFSSYSGPSEGQPSSLMQAHLTVYTYICINAWAYTSDFTVCASWMLLLRAKIFKAINFV